MSAEESRGSDSLNASRGRATLEIKATRFKSGTWSVNMRYPDGSTEGHRGLADWGYAETVITLALEKVEDAAEEVAA